MRGRRRDDVRFGELPDDLRAGDYWKYLDRETGEPKRSTEPSNLTGTCWGFVAPNSPTQEEAGDQWCMPVIGLLTKHTVREHEDGTASIRAHDGSSNSVAISHPLADWRGYMERGVWSEC